MNTHLFELVQNSKEFVLKFQSPVLCVIYMFFNYSYDETLSVRHDVAYYF